MLLILNMIVILKTWGHFASRTRGVCSSEVQTSVRHATIMWAIEVNWGKMWVRRQKSLGEGSQDCIVGGWLLVSFTVGLLYSSLKPSVQNDQICTPLDLCLFLQTKAWKCFLSVGKVLFPVSPLPLHGGRSGLFQRDNHKLLTGSDMWLAAGSKLKLKKKRLSSNASTQWTETLTSPGRIPRMISYHSWTMLCSWRWLETSIQTMTCSLTATTYMGWACNPSEAAWTKRGCTHIMKALKHVVILTRPSLNWWRWQGKNLRNQRRRNRMTDGTTSLPQCTSDQVIRRCASQHSNTNWTAQCLLYSALTIPGTSTSKGGHLLWITIVDQRWWLMTPGISHLKSGHPFLGSSSTTHTFPHVTVNLILRRFTP